MTVIEKKRPTLQITWDVLPRDGSKARTLVFASAKKKTASVEEACARPANSIAVGDRLRLELWSDMDGYLSLFDFGTSGRMTKLFPNRNFSTEDNHIEAGKRYAAPGELLPVPDFLVSGPTTAESGRKERLLVIVTRHPVDLSESAVLGAEMSFATRGGFAAVEETVSSLLDLPEDEWTYGLIETEVVS